MNELVAALTKAQQAFKPLLKSHTNPHFKSKYADLSDLLDATLPALHAEGFALVQPIEDGNVVSRLLHAAGTIESSLPLDLGGKPQDIGAQITYYRRFTLSSLLGIASEDDDDGNAASKASQRRQEPRRAAANDDGEPLATKEQTAQFTALCEAALLDRDDRKALVGKPWNQVTRDEAAGLIAQLVASDDLVLAKSQAGGWMAYKAGEEPFDLEPAAAS